MIAVWDPWIGPPWTSTTSWPFAVMIANDRASARQRKQRIQQDSTDQVWSITDV